MTIELTSTDTASVAASLPVLRVKNGEDRRLSAGHLWIFSNEVDTAATPLPGFAKGAVARVVSSRDKFLGYAYVNPNSLICARILGRDVRYVPGRSLIVHRLQIALSLRERLHDKPFYRLVYGESDGLPGLVLDRYGNYIVGQIATAGMEAMKDDIVAAVAKVMSPAGFLWKNDSGARDLEGLPSYIETAGGIVPDLLEVEENNVRYRVPALTGQKTGWFFDQASNRTALLKYVPGKRVLDVFTYLGAWGLAAARAGAAEVTCVDASAAALEQLAAIARNNGLTADTIKGDAFDVMTQLHAERRKFDVVVIDPPAFIKRKKDIPKGEAAYRRLNQLAMTLLDRDGLLVSCSCSYHLEPEQLLAAINKAARHLGRTVQVLEVGGQAPDHPIHPAIPETRYLKAFVCRVLQE